MRAWTGTCTKCAAALGVGMRLNMMHEGDCTAGYLDLVGCSPFDTQLEDCVLWVACLQCGEPSPNVRNVSRQVHITPIKLSGCWLTCHYFTLLLIPGG